MRWWLDFEMTPARFVQLTLLMTALMLLTIHLPTLIRYEKCLRATPEEKHCFMKSLQ